MALEISMFLWYAVFITLHLRRVKKIMIVGIFDRRCCSSLQSQEVVETGREKGGGGDGAEGGWGVKGNRRRGEIGGKRLETRYSPLLGNCLTFYLLDLYHLIIKSLNNE